MEVLRQITQWFGLVISHAYFKVFFTKQIYSGPLKAICLPFISCHSCPLGVFSCPIGTIQHYVIIRKIPLVLMGHLGLILIAVGRMVCGWLCPAGLLQDLAYKIKSVKIKLPRSLGYFRYVSLIVFTLFLPFIDGQAWFCRFCPVGTLEATLPWVTWNPVNPVFNMRTIDISALGWVFFFKILVLLAVVGMVFFFKRPFCRILCPLGLIFAPFNKLSLIRMEITDRSKCSNCNHCLKNCPMELKVSDNPNAGECIRCLKCTKCSKVKLSIGNLNEEPYVQNFKQ